LDQPICNDTLLMVKIFLICLYSPRPFINQSSLLYFLPPKKTLEVIFPPVQSGIHSSLSSALGRKKLICMMLRQFLPRPAIFAEITVKKIAYFKQASSKMSDATQRRSNCAGTLTDLSAFVKVCWSSRILLLRKTIDSVDIYYTGNIALQFFKNFRAPMLLTARSKTSTNYKHLHTVDGYKLSLTTGCNILCFYSVEEPDP
jgi:hypothetical protein